MTKLEEAQERIKEAVQSEDETYIAEFQQGITNLLRELRKQERGRATSNHDDRSRDLFPIGDCIRRTSP